MKHHETMGQEFEAWTLCSHMICLPCLLPSWGGFLATLSTFPTHPRDYLPSAPSGSLGTGVGMVEFGKCLLNYDTGPQAPVRVYSHLMDSPMPKRACHSITNKK